jgi:hypothetical protein
VIILAGLMLVTHTARGARVELSLAQVKRDKATVVTAEIQDVLPKTRRTTQGDGKTYEDRGFSFTLRVHEVLRGEAEMAIPIEFSRQGYACNWEFERRPQNGMKVVAYLDPAGDSGKPALYFHPNATEEIRDFDDPAVVGLRKIFAVWKLDGTAAQVKAVKTGSFDRNARFQQWCVGALTGDEWLDDGSIASHADPGETQMLLQRMFAGESADIAARVACDGYLCRNVEGFAASEERYETWAAQLRAMAEQNRVEDHNHVNVVCNLLAQFPRRADESLALLQELAGRPELCHRWTILIQIREFHGLGDAAHDTKLVDYLREKLVGDDEQSADGAAIAISQIAARIVKSGKPVPEEVESLLANREGRVKNPQVISRLEWGLKEVARLKSQTP